MSDEVVSDKTISAVDTFAIVRCQEFLANRAVDLDAAAQSFEKTFGELTEAWSSPAAQSLMNDFSKAIKNFKDRPEDLRKLSKTLEDASTRHGTAEKRAESISDAVEMPVWPEEII